MDMLFKALSSPLDLSSFLSVHADKVTPRRLTHLKDYFSDRQTVREVLAKDDPLIYEVWEVEYAGPGRGLSYGMTRLFPGTIGNEYFFTRGHFHSGDLGDEMYVVNSGKGVLLLSTRDGYCETLDLTAGQMVYVPSHLAHRTINIGTEELLFLSVWAPNIVHDYDTIAERGFPKLVVASPNGPETIENPVFFTDKNNPTTKPL